MKASTSCTVQRFHGTGQLCDEWNTYQHEIVTTPESGVEGYHILTHFDFDEASRLK